MYGSGSRVITPSVGQHTLPLLLPSGELLPVKSYFIIAQPNIAEALSLTLPYRAYNPPAMQPLVSRIYIK